MQIFLPRRRFSFLNGTVIIACLVAMLLPIGLVHADDGTTVPDLSSVSASEEQGVSCGGSAVTASGSFSAPADTYDVYARLGTGVPAETDTLYAHKGVQVTGCTTIGRATVTDKTWTKLGTYTTSGDDTGFQLVSGSAGLVQSFNQPTVLLVSRTKPACRPTTECVITVGGMKGVLRASATGGSADTLFIVRAVNPSEDSLQQVQYYVDNRLAYVQPNVQPFNMHYVGAGKHQLDTVARYKSGQRIIVSKQVDRDWLSYGFSDFLLNVFFSRRGLLQCIFGITLLLTIIRLVVWFIRWVHKRALWRRSHDTSITTPLFTERVQQYTKTHLSSHLAWTGNKIWRVGTFVMKAVPFLLIALLLIVLANRYVVILKQVSGPSMNSTFTDGDQLIVNRLGQTWARVTGDGYLPKRGDVVVLNRVLDVTDPTAADGSEFLIKRVIGLPGDRVVVNGSRVMIYNKDHPKGFDPDANSAWAKTMHRDDDLFIGSQAIEVTLQPGEVFVCGDNRPDSVDSRSFGPVQVKDIVGNVVFHNAPQSEAAQGSETLDTPAPSIGL